MPKRTIEINDTLQERVDSAIAEVKEALRTYFDEEWNGSNPFPDLSDLDESGAIHEIVDGSVPIYYGEIRDTWYLYSDELEYAYKCAGIGKDPRENYGMTAIYCHIDEAVRYWYYGEAEELWEEWVQEEERKAEQEA